MRIDDRLLHGQVVVAWGRALSPQRYLVADDDVAASAFERALLVQSAADVPVEVATVEAGAAWAAGEATREGAAVVLVRSAPAARDLVRRARSLGAAIDAVNLGGLHYAPGKEKALDYVYLDDADRAALADLAALGVRVYAQDVPAASPVEMPEAWTRRNP